MTLRTMPSAGVPIMIKTVASTAYDVGYLLYDNGSGAVAPAASQADQLTNTANQRYFASRFIGVSNGKKLVGDAGTQALPVVVDEDIYSAVAATTFAVGDYIGGIESSGGVALENAVVAKVSDPSLAIGVCVEAGTSLTIVKWRPFSKFSRNGTFAGPTLAGSTLTLTGADAGKTIGLDQLAGSVVTLPAAIGSGNKFRFYVAVLATSVSHKVQVANGTDVMTGTLFGARIDSGNAVLGFAAQATSDTITLNRTTTGSVTLGEWFEVEDVAAGVFNVRGFLTATGAAFATPFSAAVS